MSRSRKPGRWVAGAGRWRQTLTDLDDPARVPRTALVLCPTHRDHRELARLARPDTIFMFHDYASTSLEELIGGQASVHDFAADPIDEIERILAKVSGVEIEAVVSTDDYPGSALAAAVAKELGLPGTEPLVNLTCQHKYLSRVAQRAIVPDAVPAFALIDVADGASWPEALAAPFLVKPVKSFFSIGVEIINSSAELEVCKARFAKLDEFFLPLERLLLRYSGAGIGSERLIGEGLLRGMQVTVEGYAFAGEVSILGVVDSIMFPGTRVFCRFEYPSALSEGVQARMAEIAKTLMRGMGFDNGMFNIEMMYDEHADTIGIIEINPRMSSQFADLYEKIDGTNAYAVLLDIGAGRQPRVTRKDGPHRFAASCVLRTFEDWIVAALPSDAELGRFAQLEPDIRIELHAALGRRLSDDLQDGHSFRYGIINLGGRDRADVLVKFEACRANLRVSFVPAPDLEPEDRAMPAVQPVPAAPA
jgi:biotin carboxylase